ncbi:MAG TPA: DoxX family protein [Polyangiales bacterium]|nr:DoxX family protein [Polyangiales bacterium]
MNIALWIVQAALALLYLSGGAYKTFAFAELANQMTALPLAGWRTLGVIEMLGGVLLIIPAATKWMPLLTPIAATVLALETLGLVAVYAQYSLHVAATNPLVWAVVMGALVAFVAYGRYSLAPSV